MKDFGSIPVIHAAAGLMGLAAALPPLPLRPLPELVLPRVAAALEAAGA